MDYAMPDSRLNELLQLGSKEFTSAEDIGTAVSRFELYQRTIDELLGRSAKELLVGSAGIDLSPVITTNLFLPV